MPTNLFIAGDWGTSNFRLYLCEHQDNGATRSLETRNGPGASQIDNEFEETLFSLIEPWTKQHGELPVLLSGMVGSTIGWHEAPYLSCPANGDEIAEGRVVFNCRGLEVSIIAGLKTHNFMGQPDVMRGEELQLLGWMLQHPQNTQSNIVALPGTHNKWALVNGNKVENFLTSLTGETFSLLADHSVLINTPKKKHFNQQAFLEGVKTIETVGAAQLIHLLFSTRSKQILNDMASKDAPSYLSGLLIAADILGALTFVNPSLDKSLAINIVADGPLSNYYRIAIEHFGFPAIIFDSANISVSGYGSIFSKLYSQSGK